MLAGRKSRRTGEQPLMRFPHPKRVLLVVPVAQPGKAALSVAPLKVDGGITSVRRPVDPERDVAHDPQRFSVLICLKDGLLKLSWIPLASYMYLMVLFAACLYTCLYAWGTTKTRAASSA
jgi:hypothetical protein